MKSNSKSKLVIIIISSVLVFLIVGGVVLYSLKSAGIIAVSEEDTNGQNDKDNKTDDEEDKTDDEEDESDDESDDDEKDDEDGNSGNRNETLFSGMRTVYDDYASNYEYNQAIETTELNELFPINDQRTCPEFRVGNSSIADVGCEIIATYNALLLLDNRYPLSDIIMSFEKNGYIMSNGTFGSDPYGIAEYLDSISVETTEINDFREMQSMVDSDNGDLAVYIVSFWNSSSFLDGIHTIALSTDSEQFYPIYAYNCHWTEVGYFSEITDEECFIVGYRINLKNPEQLIH